VAPVTWTVPERVASLCDCVVPVAADADDFSDSNYSSEAAGSTGRKFRMAADSNLLERLKEVASGPSMQKKSNWLRLPDT
jgi:hypothetical protein